eukprot:s424_g2.t1
MVVTPQGTCRDPPRFVPARGRNQEKLWKRSSNVAERTELSSLRKTWSALQTIQDRVLKSQKNNRGRAAQLSQAATVCDEADGRFRISALPLRHCASVWERTNFAQHSRVYIGGVRKPGSTSNSLVVNDASYHT